MENDKKARVLRLVELIENANQMLAHLKTSPFAFEAEFEQYRYLKSRYEKELLELLATELDIQIPVAA